MARRVFGLFTGARVAWLTAVVVLGGSGCATFETPTQREAREENEGQFYTQVNRLIRESARQKDELASLRTEVTTLMQDREELAGRVAAASRDAADATQRCSDLQRRLTLAEKELANVDADYRRRLEDLQKAIAQEGDTREKSVKEVISSVSKELSATASQIKAEQRQMLKAMENTPGVQGEYVVAKGDNLMTIARAFGITVESLKKANGLARDTIREGQKLVIPAK